MTHEICAIDVGFHSTKGKRGNNEVAFESIAPIFGDGNDLSSGTAENKVVSVLVDGNTYVVGEDSRIYAESNQKKNLNEHYVFTAEYKALVLGMVQHLNYKDGDTIELLVLGLPINRLEQSSDLERIFTGTLKINENMTVAVKAVWVIAQPMGANYEELICSHSNNEDILEKLKSMSDEKTLTFDFGFGTICWLSTIGMRPMPNASGAEYVGVSNVMTRVANKITELGKKRGVAISIPSAELPVLERAIVRKTFKFRGIEFKREEIEPTIKAATRESISQVFNKIGDISSYSNFRISGGGGLLFGSALIEQLGVGEGAIAKATQGSRWKNVRGFYKAGVLMFDRIVGLKTANNDRRETSSAK